MVAQSTMNAIDVISDLFISKDGAKYVKIGSRAGVYIYLAPYFVFLSILD